MAQKIRKIALIALAVLAFEVIILASFAALAWSSLGN